MAQFKYTAVNRAGETLENLIEATSEGDVRVQLRSLGLRPIKINKMGEVSSKLDFSFLSRKVKDDDVLLFTRQLAILINSGIPLVQGLEIIGSQTESIALKNVVNTVQDKVNSGQFLWESLSGFQDSFSPLYINMIKAGESSGSLDKILKRLMRYLEDAIKLKKLVKSAMIYPIAVLSVGFIVVLVMLTYVIPKFEELLLTSGQELPDITKFVINASHFCSNNILFILGAIVGFIFFLKKYLSTTEGRNFFDSFILKMPLFGPLVNKVCVARLTRTMQTMLGSGINLLDAIEISRGAVGNYIFALALTKVKSEVETGMTLAAVMSRQGLFPSMMVQMITVGEATGNLDQMLERVADYYEEEVAAVVGNLTKLIEPIILVVLGGTVAGLMVAMYMPIFKMAG